MVDDICCVFMVEFIALEFYKYVAVLSLFLTRL